MQHSSQYALSIKRVIMREYEWKKGTSHFFTRFHAIITRFIDSAQFIQYAIFKFKILVLNQNL
jgi:hypothetical protein